MDKQMDTHWVLLECLCYWNSRRVCVCELKSPPSPSASCSSSGTTALWTSSSSYMGTWWESPRGWCLQAWWAGWWVGPPSFLMCHWWREPSILSPALPAVSRPLPSHSGPRPWSSRPSLKSKEEVKGLNEWFIFLHICKIKWVKWVWVEPWWVLQSSQCGSLVRQEHSNHTEVRERGVCLCLLRSEH